MNQMQHDFDAGPVAQDFGEVLGAPFKVWLANGFVETPNSAGELTVEIEDMKGLILMVVRSRALHPRKLSGDDLKFFRTSLCMRSNEIADALDVTPEHYSRCETGTKTLSSSAEKFYRMYAFLEASCKDKSLHDAPPVAATPEQAKEAMEAFRKVFFDLKIQHVYPVGEELEFHFVRRTRECCPANNGDDDGKWRNEDKPKAA
jgi:DNA-binding transcriptional regulator YiaG